MVNLKGLGFRVELPIWVEKAGKIKEGRRGVGNERKKTRGSKLSDCREEG